MLNLLKVEGLRKVWYIQSELTSYMGDYNSILNKISL